MHFPGVADRREFTLDCSLQLAIGICLYASMEEHVFAICSLSLGLYTLLRGLLNPQSKLSDALNKVNYCVRL